MNETQQKFLDLTEKFEALKEQYKAVREELNTVMGNLGIGTFIQHPTTGIVYKVVEPTGTYVEFKKIEYVRTAKLDEAKGSLSQKEAKEAGFVLPAREKAGKE